MWPSCTYYWYFMTYLSFVCLEEKWIRAYGRYRSKRSVEHGLDFVVKGLVIKVVDFDSLEVFLRIEIAFRDEESLPQDKFLNFGVIIIHDVIIDIAFLFAHLQEVRHLLSGKFISLIGRGLVVHHLIQLRKCFRVVFVYI